MAHLPIRQAGLFLPHHTEPTLLQNLKNHFLPTILLLVMFFVKGILRKCVNHVTLFKSYVILNRSEVLTFIL
jgi:hypothetical protein